MNEIQRKIFDILGVKPYETFKLTGVSADCSFQFDDNMRLFCLEQILSPASMACYYINILSGMYEIINLPEIAPEVQKKIDACLVLGLVFWVKHEDGDVHAYLNAPEKMGNRWRCGIGTVYLGNIDAPWIRWEDEHATDIRYLKRINENERLIK